MGQEIVSDHKNPEHTAEYMRSRLSYDPSSGIFTWKPIPVTSKWDNRWNLTWAHKPAGSMSRTGYQIICVDYIRHMAHRLAWLIHFGDWPSGYIDHVNGVRSDNRINNLREASLSQNCQNSKVRKDNTSGYKGVSKDHYTDKWLAQVWKNGQHHRVGLFPTKEEAFAAYCEKAMELHDEFFSSGHRTNG